MITLGKIRITRSANEFPEDFIKSCLARHHSGDWGEVCDEDREANELAAKQGLRIISVYPLRGEDIWIITEADRSSTTILTPQEY
jgi:hypothetical protein